MKWALINDENIITSIIVYNGVDEYLPAEGLRLLEVDNTYEVGDIFTPQ